MYPVYAVAYSILVIMYPLKSWPLMQEIEAKKKQEAEKRLADKRGGREPTHSAIVAVER